MFEKRKQNINDDGNFSGERRAHEHACKLERISEESLDFVLKKFGSLENVRSESLE